MSRATNKVATLFIQAGGSLWKLNRAEMAEMAAMGDEGVDWLIDNKRPLRTPGKKKDGTWKGLPVGLYSGDGYRLSSSRSRCKVLSMDDADRGEIEYVLGKAW